MLSLVNLVAGRPWAVQAELAAHVHGLVARSGIAALRDLAEIKAAAHASDARMLAPARTGGAGGVVAVVPIVGTLTQRGTEINSASTRSTDRVAAEVATWARDPGVDAIVLEVDSPGGEVFGVPEAWQAIRGAAARKPIVAAVNSIAASAAYYLASAADEVIVTPGGLVGSIGVYLLHIDASRAIEAAGEKWTFISAGKYKIEGNPAEPLQPEAQVALQGEVDRYYGMFVRDVARGRGVSVDTVRSGFGEGRMLGARAAVEQRMADSVGTFAEAIGRAAALARERRTAAGARAASGALGML